MHGTQPNATVSRPATIADLGRAVPRAPEASAFAEYPASWYLFGSATEISRGPVSRQVLGQELVAFRGASGQVSIMHGRCSHMGADLGRGKVIGDCIECPFHGWRYGADGRCAHVPQLGKIPERARQAVYPAVERHGVIFFFNGERASFPLPFLIDEDPRDCVAARPVTFVADCTWFMVAAHGYDSQHFDTVHSRRLHGPLAVDCPEPYARRSRYSADVLGSAYYDRLLRRFAGPTVDISITTWGGTVVTISGRFRRAVSRFMIFLTPLQGGRTRCDVIAFAPKARGLVSRMLLQPSSLWLRRLFTGAYLIAETESLGSPKYDPLSLIEADRQMIDYFCWIAELTKPTARGPLHANHQP
jgi:nitrite reductase/ring-hydroxylating ferredoxin subunit